MKQRKLKTKWMLITTTITFLTIFLFSIIIIFFLSNSLRHNEVDEAERSSEDIVKLFESKQIEHVTPLDLNASLGNFQKVMLFNEDGHKLMETSNDNSITFSPNIAPTNVNRIAVKSDHKKDYLIITDHIESPKFNGYSVIVHSLEDYKALVNSLYFIA